MFRNVLFWLHLVAGVVAGTIILIMSVTGVLLTFQQSVLRYVERSARQVEVPAGAERLPADGLIARVEAQRPGERVTGLTIEAEDTSAVAVSLGAETVYANPYTGLVTGGGATQARAFYRSVTNWHRWLAREGEARTTARAITGACNAAFLVLAVTGLYLWWPRQWTWRHLSPVVWFRGGLSGKARDFNWHNVIGLWCAPVLIVLTATGMVISYPWASNLVYTLSGSPLPAGRGGGPGGPGGRGGGPAAASGSPEGEHAGRGARADGDNSGGRQGPRAMTARTASATPEPGRSIGVADLREAGSDVPPDAVPVQRLLDSARRQMPTWSTMALRLPAEGSGPATISLTDGAHWNAFARSSLTLDRASGEVTRWEPYAASSRGQKLRGWMRFAHTGELGGRSGEAVAGLASFGGVFLVYTGIALSLRRFAAWRRRLASDRGSAMRSDRAA